MPNSLNTRLLRVTNEEENGEIRTQIRPREYDFNISLDNFDGFIPYRDTSNTSDVRISYDYIYIPSLTTLSNADTRISYSSLDSVSLKCLETLKEFQQFCWNVQFKYNKKSKVFYNKI